MMTVGRPRRLIQGLRPQAPFALSPPLHHLLGVGFFAAHADAPQALSPLPPLPAGAGAGGGVIRRTVTLYTRKPTPESAPPPAEREIWSGDGVRRAARRTPSPTIHALDHVVQALIEQLMIQLVVLLLI